jgi:hypothetical protein
MTLYARREPTTDAVTLKYVKDRRHPQWLDVVLYADAEALRPVARYPNHYSNKPRRSQRHVMHNCARYQLVWI